MSYVNPYEPEPIKAPTVCWRLFNEIFAVRIQNKFLWDDKITRRAIGYHYNDDDANKELVNMFTTVYRTPVAMAMLYDKGVELVVDQRKDCLTIYNLINRHLENWAALIASPIPGRIPPPAEDFLVLENFSVSLYEDAAFEQLTEDAKGMIREQNHIDQLLSPFGHRRRKQKMLVTTSVDENITTQPIQNASKQMRSAWDSSPWGVVIENGNP